MKASFLILVLGVIGCSWLGPEQTLPKENAGLIQKGKILNKERLAAGENLLLKPFVPGSGVEATDEFDKVSYRILKGLADSLKGNRPYFNILLDDENTLQQSNVVIEGYITEMKQDSGLFWGKKSVTLGVRGKMIDKVTGETILVFSDIRESNNKEEDYKQLGLVIGQKIGSFIVGGVQETVPKPGAGSEGEAK